MDDHAVTVELPWPPSINHYTRHTSLPIGPPCPRCKQRKSSVRVLLSAEGRMWLRLADRTLFAAGHKPFAGDVSVTITLHPPDRRQYDIDNRQKAILDALKRRPKDEKQTAWLFDRDDSQVVELRTLKAGVVPDGRCIVTVRSAGGQGVLDFGKE